MIHYKILTSNVHNIGIQLTRRKKERKKRRMNHVDQLYCCFHTNGKPAARNKPTGRSGQQGPETEQGEH